MFRLESIRQIRIKSIRQIRIKRHKYAHIDVYNHTIFVATVHLCERNRGQIKHILLAFPLAICEKSCRNCHLNAEDISINLFLEEPCPKLVKFLFISKLRLHWGIRWTSHFPRISSICVSLFLEDGRHVDTRLRSYVPNI